VHEQCVIGSSTNDPDLETVIGVPTGKTVENIKLFTSVEIVYRSFKVDVVSVLIKLDIDIAPPDIVGRLGLIHDPLVFGTPTGLSAGITNERTISGDCETFLHANGFLIKPSRSEISMNIFDTDTVVKEIESHSEPPGTKNLEKAFSPGEF